MRPSDLGALIPIHSEPAESLENFGDSLIDVSSFVCVIDAQNELPAMLPGEQPIEKSCSCAANVKVSGRAWGKPRSHCHRHRPPLGLVVANARFLANAGRSSLLSAVFRMPSERPANPPVCRCLRK